MAEHIYCEHGFVELDVALNDDTDELEVCATCMLQRTYQQKDALQAEVERLKAENQELVIDKPFDQRYVYLFHIDYENLEQKPTEANELIESFKEFSAWIIHAPERDIVRIKEAADRHFTAIANRNGGSNE